MKFSILEKVLLSGNVCVTSLLAISYLAPLINPDKYWFVALLGLVYPILFIINILYVIYWFIQSRKIILISLICLFLGWRTMTNYWAFYTLSTSHRDKKLKSALRLMTYNVHNFESVDPKNKNYTDTAIINLLGGKRPDIIAFQEFHLMSSRFAICDSLRKSIHTKHYYFEPFISSDADSTGLAIFSKFPIVKQGVIKLSNMETDNQGIYADIRSPSGIFRVYSVHLQSILLNNSDLKITGRKSAKNLINKLKVAFITRSKQVKIVKAHAEICPYPYVVLGDFNDTPNSYTVKQMSHGLRNAFNEKGRGLGVTFNQLLPMFQIDYILLSPEFTVLDYQILRKKISDHYPVYSEVILNNTLN